MQDLVVAFASVFELFFVVIVFCFSLTFAGPRDSWMGNPRGRDGDDFLCGGAPLLALGSLRGAAQRVFLAETLNMDCRCL